MIKQLLITIFLIGTFSFSLSGQNDKNEKAPSQHVLHLKNGSSLIGVLEAYAMNEPAIIVMGDGERIIVPYNLIESVSKLQGKVKPPKLKFVDRPYTFNEKGWHFQGGAGIVTSTPYSSNGFAVELGFAYHFSRMFGIGLNTGMDNYNTDLGHKVIPIYLSLQGFLTPKKVTPFYSIGLGIGSPLFDEDIWEDIENKPGFLFYPKIGLRTSGDDSFNMTIFTGLKIQSTHTRIPFNCIDGDCIEFTEQQRTYRRYVIGVGFIF